MKTANLNLAALAVFLLTACGQDLLDEQRSGSQHGEGDDSFYATQYPANPGYTFGYWTPTVSASNINQATIVSAFTHASTKLGGISVTAADPGLLKSDLNLGQSLVQPITNTLAVTEDCLVKAFSNYAAANNIAAGTEGDWLISQGAYPRGTDAYTGTSAILYAADVTRSMAPTRASPGSVAVAGLSCSGCHTAHMLVPNCAAAGACGSTTSYTASYRVGFANGLGGKNHNLIMQAISDAATLAEAGSCGTSAAAKEVNALVIAAKRQVHNSSRGTIVYGTDWYKQNASSSSFAAGRHAAQIAHMAVTMSRQKDSYGIAGPNPDINNSMVLRPLSELNSDQANYDYLAAATRLTGTRYDGLAMLPVSVQRSWFANLGMMKATSVFSGNFGCASTNGCQATQTALVLEMALNNRVDPGWSATNPGPFGLTQSPIMLAVNSSGTQKGSLEASQILHTALYNHVAAPADPNIVKGRNLTYTSYTAGKTIYSNKCASCHGSVSEMMDAGIKTYKITATTPAASKTMAFNSPYLDWVRGVLHTFRTSDGVFHDPLSYSARNMWYGNSSMMVYNFPANDTGPAFSNEAAYMRTAQVPSLYSKAQQTVWACSPTLKGFLMRGATDPGIVAIDNRLIWDVAANGYKAAWSGPHTSTNQSYATTNYPTYSIWWAREDGRCPLTTGGYIDWANAYDSSVHASPMSGMTATDADSLINFMLILAADQTVTPDGYTLKLQKPMSL